MAEAVAKKAIEGRLRELVNALNKDDYDRMSTYYTPEASSMYQGMDTVTGKQATKEAIKNAKGFNKFVETSVEEIYYFELLDDNTAYCNVHVKSTFKQSDDKITRRVTMLWRKLSEQWFVERQFFNFREPSPQDKAKQDIELQLITLYDAFSKMDIDGALKVYSDNPTWMFNEQEPITGKKDGYAAFKILIPNMKTLVLDEIFYFEMFGQSTAHTNQYVNLIDENGKVFNRIRDCFLWKKVGDKWLINRDTYNDVPLK